MQSRENFWNIRRKVISCNRVSLRCESCVAMKCMCFLQSKSIQMYGENDVCSGAIHGRHIYKAIVCWTIRPFDNETFDHMYCANCMCKLSIGTSIHWINMCKALNYSCFDCVCKTACANVDYVGIWIALVTNSKLALHSITWLNLTNDMTAYTKRTAHESRSEITTQRTECVVEDYAICKWMPPCTTYVVYLLYVGNAFNGTQSFQEPNSCVQRK